MILYILDNNRSCKIKSSLFSFRFHFRHTIKTILKFQLMVSISNSTCILEKLSRDTATKGNKKFSFNAVTQKTLNNSQGTSITEDQQRPMPRI